MKTTELRIGNLITYHDAIITVEGIVKNCIYHSGLCFDSGIESYQPFEPIILTKEWLIKFGFTESNQLFVYKGDNFQIFIYPNISDDYFHFSANKWLIVNVWYVHQLQNLIFTILGVELQISST